MKYNRAILAVALAAVSTAALAEAAPATEPTLAPIATDYAPKVAVHQVGAAAAGAAAAIFLKPKVGIRVSAGNWREFMIAGGVDVTFNVPFIPLPGIRVDGEVWGKPSDFGGDRRGNAVSLMGVQTFMLGYAALGPSYYFTDDNGDHRSGFGAKALAGISLPGGLFGEASVILGPKQPPVFFSVGMRF